MERLARATVLVLILVVFEPDEAFRVSISYVFFLLSAFYAKAAKFKFVIR